MSEIHPLPSSVTVSDLSAALVPASRMLLISVQVDTDHTHVIGRLLHELSVSPEMGTAR